MPWTRGVAQVTAAEVINLTGQQELANLVGGDATYIDDLLVSASDAIFDQLDGQSVAPGLLTNAGYYDRAIAYHLLGMLYARGYIVAPENADVGTDPYSWSDPFYKRIKPRTSADDAPAHGGSGVPSFANQDPAPYYKPGLGPRDRSRRIWHNFPGGRS